MKIFGIDEMIHSYLSTPYKSNQHFGTNKYDESLRPSNFALLSSQGKIIKGASLRTDFYEFIICMKGKCTKIVGGYELNIVPRTLHIVPPHVLNFYKSSSDDLLLYRILFRSELFNDLLKNYTFIDELMACAMDQPPLLKMGQNPFYKIKRLLLTIDTEIKKGDFYSIQIIQTLLLSFIFYVKRILKYQHELSSTIHPQLNISYKFRKLVEENYLTMRTIKEYADKMNVTSKCLTANVKEETGKSPLYIIHQRILSEAEYLLTYSNFSIKEIADKLEFDTMSHFSRFFVRNSGTTPGSFRKRV